MKNVRREDWESLKPTVYGWGINDVNYRVGGVRSKDGVQIKGPCPYYEDWTNMIQRCHDIIYKKSRPTYKDCNICEEWKYLSNFIKWVNSQPNKDWQNCQLDKDILGNNFYSPDTCCYIDNKLNSFLLTRSNDRGDLMLGVSLSKSKNKPYRASCSNPFTKEQEHLGSYFTEIEAHLAWLDKKLEHVYKLASMQADPRVAIALVERYEDRIPSCAWNTRQL